MPGANPSTSGLVCGCAGEHAGCVMRDVRRIPRLYAAQGTGLFQRAPPPGAVLPLAKHAAGLSRNPQVIVVYCPMHQQYCPKLRYLSVVLPTKVPLSVQKGLHFTRCLGCNRDRSNMIDQPCHACLIFRCVHSRAASSCRCSRSRCASYASLPWITGHTSTPPVSSSSSAGSCRPSLLIDRSDRM